MDALDRVLAVGDRDFTDGVAVVILIKGLIDQLITVVVASITPLERIRIHFAIEIVAVFVVLHIPFRRCTNGHLSGGITESILVFIRVVECGLKVFVYQTVAVIVQTVAGFKVARISSAIEITIALVRIEIAGTVVFISADLIPILVIWIIPRTRVTVVSRAIPIAIPLPTVRDVRTVIEISANPISIPVIFCIIGAQVGTVHNAVSIGINEVEPIAV
jgi:hypothetical protein